MRPAGVPLTGEAFMAAPVSVRAVADELELLGLGDGLHVFLNRRP